LDRLVGAAGLGSRVRFLGRIDDDRLARLYRESILLATSSLEGFGLPPIEAVVAGGRVVAAPIAAYRESLGTAGVIAAASSAASLSDAVEAASAQPASPRDRDVLLARFGSAAVAGSLATAYRALDA
ncbi:MAG TPA: glycosyltransferase, partial [Candidatus Limnocylindrales bacterium]